MKKCKKCRQEKELNEFQKHPETRDRLCSICKVCSNEKQRIYRAESHNSCTRKYEKTKKGYLMRLYRNMKSRIDGVQTTKIHLYQNKALCNKEEFYTWALNQEQFHKLFNIYENNGFDRRLAPSVDRVDSSIGYEFYNMEFIPMWENCSRGAKNKKILNQLKKG